jgi:hypothetical protein
MDFARLIALPRAVPSYRNGKSGDLFPLIRISGGISRQNRRYPLVNAS